MSDACGEVHPSTYHGPVFCTEGADHKGMHRNPDADKIWRGKGDPGMRQWAYDQVTSILEDLADYRMTPDELLYVFAEVQRRIADEVPQIVSSYTEDENAELATLWARLTKENS